MVLSEDKQKNLADNQVQPGPVTLGVRPEHLHLAEAGEQKITGTVEVSEMMGSAVHLHVSACGTDTIMIVQTMDIGENTALPHRQQLKFFLWRTYGSCVRPRDGREPGAAEDGIGSIFIMKTESCCRAGFFCKKENSGYGKEIRCDGDWTGFH